jgi:hypothetical protein
VGIGAPAVQNDLVVVAVVVPCAIEGGKTMTTINRNKKKAILATAKVDINMNHRQSRSSK